MARQITDDRVRGLLFEAYVDAFLVEHSVTWKSASRYPFGDRTRQEWRDLLQPDFEHWLETTCLIGDDERERILAAPTTLMSEPDPGEALEVLMADVLREAAKSRPSKQRLREAVSRAERHGDRKPTPEPRR